MLAPYHHTSDEHPLSGQQIRLAHRTQLQGKNPSGADIQPPAKIPAPAAADQTPQVAKVPLSSLAKNLKNVYNATKLAVGRLVHAGGDLHQSIN